MTVPAANFRLGIVGQSQIQGVTGLSDLVNPPWCNWGDALTTEAGSSARRTWFPKVTGWLHKKYGWNTWIENRAVGGTQVGSTGGNLDQSWHPTAGITPTFAVVTTYPWRSLAWYDSLLNMALDFFEARQITHVEMCFGSSDANISSTTAATYQSDLGDVVDALVTAGYRVMVHMCTNTGPGLNDDEWIENVHDGWLAYCAASADGQWIFQGADMYGDMNGKGDADTPGPLFTGGSSAHVGDEGYDWCAQRVIDRYARTNWHMIGR